MAELLPDPDPRSARAALVALAGPDDPGDAEARLRRAVLDLTRQGEPDQLDELLSPLPMAARPRPDDADHAGAVVYRVDRHERGSFVRVEGEVFTDAVAAINSFLDAAGQQDEDESVLLFSATDDLERLVASAANEGPVCFHPPEPAAFSGSGAEGAALDWAEQLQAWESTWAQPGDPEVARLVERIVELERELEERSAEVEWLRAKLASLDARPGSRMGFARRFDPRRFDADRGVGRRRGPGNM